MIFIDPPYAQLRHEFIVNIGPVIPIPEALGVHIPIGTGIHGPGVNTPKAAAVSEAVIGLAKLMHTPNGFIFKNGTKSTHDPIGPEAVISIDNGKKVKGVGATPKEHIAKAPFPTANPATYISLLSCKSPFIS